MVEFPHTINTFKLQGDSIVLNARKPRLSVSTWSLHRTLGSPPIYGPGDEPGDFRSDEGALPLLDLPARGLDRLRRLAQTLKNELQGGSRARVSRLSTTPPAQKSRRGTYPRMRRRLGGFAAA